MGAGGGSRVLQLQKVLVRLLCSDKARNEKGMEGRGGPKRKGVLV